MVFTTLGIGLLIALIITYIQNVLLVSNLCFYCPKVVQEMYMHDDYFSNSLLLVRYSIENIFPLGMFFGALVIGLWRNKKWLTYSLLLSILFILLSRNLIKIIWPTPYGAGKELGTVQMIQDARNWYFRQMIDDLPFIIISIISGTFLGKMLYKVLGIFKIH